MMTARIYKPARSAMQSGTGKAEQWLLTFEATQKSADPLMGWTSTSDTQEQVTLRFDTKDEAIAYAQREGLAYTVAVESPARMNKKSYSDNFRWGRTENWTH
jgi:ETC complex I subunit conserved region